MSYFGGEDTEQPITKFVGRLLDDGKAYATAELFLLRARAEKTVNDYRKPVILASIAVVLAFGTLIVLCIAFVLALSSLIGPWLGGLAAVLLVGGATAIIAYLAKKAFEDADER